MKKGQKSMEFLMTYGWAILVVLASIGALAYFGVFEGAFTNPVKITQECCDDFCHEEFQTQCVAYNPEQEYFRCDNPSGLNSDTNDENTFSKDLTIRINVRNVTAVCGEKLNED